MAWGPKDKDAIRDFGIDWTADLPDGVTIEASTWLLDGEAWAGGGDLVKEASSFTDTNTTVRISGGVNGTSYVITNHIVMSDGEEDDFSQKLKIKER
ncbi:phage fiber-tail adaptor protein [Mesorhizobium sp. 128a]